MEGVRWLSWKEMWCVLPDTKVSIKVYLKWSVSLSPDPSLFSCTARCSSVLQCWVTQALPAPACQVTPSDKMTHHSWTEDVSGFSEKQKRIGTFVAQPAIYNSNSPLTPKQWKCLPLKLCLFWGVTGNVSRAAMKRKDVFCVSHWLGKICVVFLSGIQSLVLPRAGHSASQWVCSMSVKWLPKYVPSFYPVLAF